MQELVDKAPKLPNDTRWHFVGHLQSNKAKMLVGEACQGVLLLTKWQLG